jgi:hypothetical protein
MRNIKKQKTRRSITDDSGMPIRSFLRIFIYPTWIVVCLLSERIFESLFAIPGDMATLQIQLADNAESSGLRTRLAMSAVAFLIAIVAGIVLLTWITRKIPKYWSPRSISSILWELRLSFRRFFGKNISVLVIPHNERKVANYRISRGMIYSVAISSVLLFLGLLAVLVVLTARLSSYTIIEKRLDAEIKSKKSEIETLTSQKLAIQNALHSDSETARILYSYQILELKAVLINDKVISFLLGVLSSVVASFIYSILRMIRKRYRKPLKH